MAAGKTAFPIDPLRHRDQVRDLQDHSHLHTNTVATSSYLANDGDGYGLFYEANIVDTGYGYDYEALVS